MNKCFVCDRVIETVFTNLFEDCNNICYECAGKLKQRNEKFVVDGCDGVILYFYDDFFKNILFRYKGCGDYFLNEIFLLNHYSRIKRKYKGYSIVLAPSNQDVEEKRGFCHLEGIFKRLNMPIVKCFRKVVEWKQSDKYRAEREQIQNVIKIDKSGLLGVKKVLIVDDVLTSGSTIKTMVSQIPTNILKKVLILSSNCRILKNEII